MLETAWICEYDPKSQMARAMPHRVRNCFKLRLSPALASPPLDFKAGIFPSGQPSRKSRNIIV